MMNSIPPKVILSTEGFATRPELAAHAEEKAAKLLRHSHPRVLRLRINLKHQKPHAGQPHFFARALAEGDGANHIAHAVAAQPEAAINAVVDKLERAISSSADARKYEQHHPHEIDLPGALPKIA
jgi:ribosome-associated translation inhibitor RaiA